MAETSNVLRVNIVTPDGLVYDHHARMLVVHSVAGELGIMANHEPIVTPLEIGEVDVQRVDASDHNDSIAVNGGFMEVSENVLPSSPILPSVSVILISVVRKLRAIVLKSALLKQRMIIIKTIFGGHKSHCDGPSTELTSRPVIKHEKQFSPNLERTAFCLFAA